MGKKKRKATAAATAIRDRIIDFRRVPASELEPHPENWRTHPDNQRAALRGVLSEIGFADALLVRQNNGKLQVIDGHLRREEMGSTEVPVLVTDLTEEEARKMLATLDPLAAMAEADTEKLGALLQSIDAESEEMRGLMASLAKEHDINMGDEPPEDPGPQIDRAAELQKEWKTELGQLWEIPGKAGVHRVLCGDSTKREDVGRVCGGEVASLVITDPPYGVEYADKNKFLNTISRGNHIQKPIAGDHGDKADIQAIWKTAFHEMANVMQPGAVVYCFMPQGGDQMMMMMMMMGAGIEPRHELIWLKNNHVLGRVDYAYKHEPILYAWKEGGHKFYGEFQTSILEFAKPQSSNMHPTTKPVKLLARLVDNSSQRDEMIYDPFLGSGTTLVACEQLGRIGYGIEIAPQYVAVTLERLKDMGLEPRLTV